MADFAQAVKWMQQGKVVIREQYEYQEYALEPVVRGKREWKALVMRHMPDLEWEDPILIEADLMGNDWQSKPKRKPKKIKL